MASAIVTYDPYVVGHNLEEASRLLGAGLNLAKAEITALQAGGLAADLATTTPANPGTGAVGDGTHAARNNHVHPPAYPGYVYLGDALAATTTAEFPIMQFTAATTISALDIKPGAALTASDTVYATITLKNRDASGSATTVATLITNVASGSWTAFVNKTCGAITNGVFAAGSCLTMTIAKASTGTAVPAMIVAPTFA